MDSLISNAQRIKLSLHVAQAVFIFVAWAIEIAYFTKAVFVGSSTSWYFALCFLSVPALVYQTMTQLFARSRKWANPYAFAAIDVVYTILWLSAFASVASWNTYDLCIGACSLSKAMVGLGFMIFVFFALTSAISVYGVLYYRNHKTLPGASRVPNNAALIDPDRDAFSTAPHDEYAPVHDKDDDHPNGPNEMNGGQRYDTSAYSGVGGYVPPHVSDEVPAYGSSNAAGAWHTNTNTAYGGAAAAGPSSEAGTAWNSNASYSAEAGSSIGYGGAPGHERVQFPAGNYN